MGTEWKTSAKEKVLVGSEIKLLSSLLVSVEKSLAVMAKLMERMPLRPLRHSWIFSDCFSSSVFNKCSTQCSYSRLTCSFKRGREELKKKKWTKSSGPNHVFKTVYFQGCIRTALWKQHVEQFLLAIVKIQPFSMSVKWMTSLSHGIFYVVKVLKNSKQPSPCIYRLYWNWPAKYKPETLGGL